MPAGGWTYQTRIGKGFNCWGNGVTICETFAIRALQLPSQGKY